MWPELAARRQCGPRGQARGPFGDGNVAEDQDGLRGLSAHALLPILLFNISHLHIIAAHRRQKITSEAQVSLQDPGHG